MTQLQKQLAGARSPRWIFTLLNSQDQPLRDLTTVKSWSIELNANTRLGASGNLELLNDEDIDYQKHRLKVTYDPGVEDVEPWNIGVFLFSQPGVEREPTHSTVKVKLISKLAIVDEDTTLQTHTVPSGANLVQEAERLLRSIGEKRLHVEPSELLARESIQFKAGEPVLTIVNELLDAAGYWSLTADGGGTYRVYPYQLPSERPVVWDFEAGVQAIHTPSWSKDQNISNVPNRVVCRTGGEDDKPALVGVAENTREDSPYSFQARGRWVTRVYDVEAAGQAEINALAQRRLIQAGNPVSTVKIEHAPVPVFPRQAVRFKSEGIDTTATIAKMSFSSPGYLVATELKEVSSDHDPRSDGQDE